MKRSFQISLVLITMLTTRLVALDAETMRDGKIVLIRNGPGLVLLNAQSRVSSNEVSALASAMQTAMNIPVCVRNTSSKDSGDALAQNMLHGEGTNRIAFVVVLVDVRKQPSMLVAPEDRWALVNLGALDLDNPSASVLRDRANRELWRAACYVMGTANSLYEGCSMKPVLSLKDLDALPIQPCPEPFTRMESTWAATGVQQLRTLPYRKALELGLAPAPTNDFQRKIWEEVKKKSR